MFPLLRLRPLGCAKNSNLLTGFCLKDILFRTVSRRLVSSSEEDVWEYVETNLQYVAEHLRDAVAEWNIDGAIPTFEIDAEPSPYIRLIAELPSDVIAKLRRIDPFQLGRL